jgi:hypothetical protein
MQQFLVAAVERPDLHDADPGCVVLQLMSFGGCEGVPLLDLEHVAVALGGDADALTGGEHPGHVLELDGGRVPLYVAVGSRSRIGAHEHTRVRA